MIGPECPAAVVVRQDGPVGQSFVISLQRVACDPVDSAGTGSAPGVEEDRR